MTDTDLEAKALAGDTEAQCSLAFLYEIGLDRPLDYQKAAHYWQMAAKAGKQLAIDKLKRLLDTGRIQPSSLEKPRQSPIVKHSTSQVVLKPQMAQGPKILLADDEEEFRALMAESLEAAQFRLVLAHNGEDAVQKVLANPDLKLIITDLKMPKLNGLQFIRTIRRMQLAEDALVAVLTAYSQPKLIAEGKKLNVDSWLVKPIKPSVLIETVKKLLERKSQVG